MDPGLRLGQVAQPLARGLRYLVEVLLDRLCHLLPQLDDLISLLTEIFIESLELLPIISDLRL